MSARSRDAAQLGLFADREAGDGAPVADPALEPRAVAADAMAAGFIGGPLPDEAARVRIRSDLETNLLVEAGAGSGKTTALVQRMVALVSTGAATVDSVAAVTFTRKAAAELRQRFQTELEAEAAAARSGDAAGAVRLDRAVRNVDRAFIGTIHSFCARLLRERPVEAGLDPHFREMMGPEEVRLGHAFWRSHLESLHDAGDPMVSALADVGLAPSRLRGLFDAVVANPDVEFPSDPVDPPEPAAVEAVRRRLDRLIDRGLLLMPSMPAERGWDDMQRRLRLLDFLRRVVAWDRTTDFLDTIGEEFHGRSHGVTKNRWPDGDAAKELERDWSDLRDGAAAAVLDRWWAHRYPIAMAFARRAAGEYAAERRRTGRLNFQDLLMLAARLLREHAAARAELGERYRYVLVDEFQDTDPVQAEVLLLLASPPDGRPWQEAGPRPGALFVVGDPKQSIYRFRRADIAIYNLVRDRFDDFGAVIELVANFRSLPPIGMLVDGVFGAGRFPDRATAHQAAFAPLRTRRSQDPELQRVAQYHVEGRSRAAAAADEAARLVPWIAGEIAAGRRRPADFLILARQKAELATYARALEAWHVPVQVTGAGVDRSEELDELLLLMDALADPTDPVRVVAVLVGLFFGLDHDDLIAWALADDLPEADRTADRRDFDITMPRPDDATEVGRALARLHSWWQLSRKDPADVLVGRIVDEIGLVPLAAARDLGEIRAGSLRFALDAIRIAALDGDTSVVGAIDAIRAALDSDESEAPLEPVRRGVVRVMTLHQAKGLEAPVVALANPVGSRDHEITRHIERAGDGSAIGYLVVQERDGYRNRVVARPPGWEERCDEERRFERAEQDRLLYVAATRAADTLLVARRAGDEDRSPWAGLYGWIDAHGETLALDPRTPPEPLRMARGADKLVAAAAAVAEERSVRARPSYVVTIPTTVAKGGTAAAWLDPAPAPGDSVAGPDVEGGTEPHRMGGAEAQGFRGLTWGSAVHGALDAATRGAEGTRLRSLCRSILLEEERPAEGGEPVELDELVDLVGTVLGSPVWRRARSAERLLSEAPFAFRVPASWQELLDATDTADPAPAPGAPRILEGVVDLVFRERDGWVIVDYKTDIGTDPGFPSRRAGYRRQVELYARVWEALTAEPVKERVLWFTARAGDVESW